MPDIMPITSAESSSSLASSDGWREPDLNVTNIPLEQIQTSHWNPRTKLDKDAFQNLIASIREKGLLEPLLVRPIDPPKKAPSVKFEIVCGERRYRAMKEIGFKTIPSIVRRMSDGEALEASIVENLQREGVTEIEEANAFRRLTKTDTGSADNGAQTVEEIARKVGKSPEYIYARLKLLDLEGAARQALAEGAISAGHAVIIARMTPENQVRAVKFCRSADHEGNTPSVKDLMREKQEEWERSLKGAPWGLDDATLVSAAGSCRDCPKREGTACHDPHCFAKKQTAFVELELKSSPELAKLSLDWSRKESAGIIPRSRWTDIGKDKPCPSHRQGIIVEGAPYGSRDHQIGEILIVCTNPKCPVHHFTPSVSSDGGWRKREQKARDQRKGRVAARVEIVKQIVEKAATDSADRALRIALNSLLDNLDGERGRILGPLIDFKLPANRDYQIFGRRVENQIVDSCKTPQDLKRALVAAALLEDLSNEYSKGDLVEQAARRYRVNARAIEKRTLAALAEAAKANKTRKPAKGLHTSAKGENPCPKNTPKHAAKRSSAKPSKRSSKRLKGAGI